MMFLSRRYRPNMWPLYGLVGIELALTVALLTLVGIAAPNLYRTKLWQDGADNGFNSSPLTGLYAAANYRPYTTPKVWSQFITNYNLVVVVLSMFILLCKSTMFLLHVLPPILSVLLHAIEIVLYAIAVAYQASSDTTDPKHPQNGPAWYITKSCSVTHNKRLTGYCMQAKATFACFCAMLAVFVIYFGISFWSCFPSKQQVRSYSEKRNAKKLRWAYKDEEQNKQVYSSGAIPDTPGFQAGITPATPRTTAFNKLGGTKDLPLRAPDTKSKKQTAVFSLRSPGILRTPMTFGHTETEKVEPVVSEVAEESASAQNKLYFPPPPKRSTKA